MHSAQHLETLFERMERGESMSDIMKADERSAGYTVVVPGEVQWLPADDWDPTIVVSIDGKRVRLVAILAKRPGNGAFRRLVAAIRAANLVPHVIAPTHEMRATLKRWGWRMRIRGARFDLEEIWHPRAVSTAERTP